MLNNAYLKAFLFDLFSSEAKIDWRNSAWQRATTAVGSEGETAKRPTEGHSGHPSLSRS